MQRSNRIKQNKNKIVRAKDRKKSIDKIRVVWQKLPSLY